MKFKSKPDNYFDKFINLYFTKCKERCPKIEAIAGKWTSEDLIPGLSDFDARFICSDDMSDEDWCNMSAIVGEVHLEICRDHPEWIRLLEHLPGVNPTWEEFTADFYYYPEYRQWTIYQCVDKDKAEKAQNILDSRKWEIRDEYFFLNKFLKFYGRYNRSIDPAINLGDYENKYPLHSRTMHYFTPPVQAAVSVILKKPVRGKLEALRIARDMFPDLDIFDEIFNILDKHFEIAELYREPELSLLEGRLFSALNTIKDKLKDYITLIPENERNNTAVWKKYLDSIDIPPQMKVFDSSRFSRLFKGRLNFFRDAPSYFDSIPLIFIEFSRMRDMFFTTPFKIYIELNHAKETGNFIEIIRKLLLKELTKEEMIATLRFSELGMEKCTAENAKDLAGETAKIFDDFFMALGKIRRLIR